MRSQLGILESRAKWRFSVGTVSLEMKLAFFSLPLSACTDTHRCSSEMRASAGFEIRPPLEHQLNHQNAL